MHSVSLTLRFRKVEDTYLGSISPRLGALERTGSPWLFGMYWVWEHENPNPINLPKKSIDRVAHTLSQILSFRYLKYIYLGSISPRFGALERMGSPWLFGMYWVWVHSQTQ